MIEWKQRARELADALEKEGVLSQHWRPAFEAVPRHEFVPWFYDVNNAVIDGGDPAQNAAWLDAVYSDSSLVTQIANVPGQNAAWPTSSSTKPGLMARMLGLLSARDGDTAMEIGLGTGYNFAIMSERLGSERTASIDIDPALVDTARERLTALGYVPRVVAGDGALGIPDFAPYNRIIATCAVPAIPPAWIEQLSHRGTIVADLRSDLASALVTVVKTSDDTVQGRFLPVPGHFMWLRAEAGNPLRHGGILNITTDLSGAEESTTHVDPSILDDEELRFMLMITLPGFASLWPIDDGRLYSLRFTDGSWAEISKDVNGTGTRKVVEGGPQRVWHKVQEAIQRWESFGRPDRSRFGLTAGLNGEHLFWLDEVEKVISINPHW